MLPKKSLITNIGDNIRLECDNYTQEISKINAGTIKINIPCECQLCQDDNILLTKVKPCDIQNNRKDTRPIQLIPATWTKLTTLQLFPIEADINYTSSNLSEVIDLNWT